MKPLFFYITLFVFFIFGLTFFNSCKNTTEKKTEQQDLVKFQCPMDCENGKTYDEPGQCPVCKMDLEKLNN